MTASDILAFEKAWMNRPQHDGSKVQAIASTFDLTPTRYYQQVRGVLQDPQAWAVDPVTCRLLTERMKAGSRQRSA